ncbi:beta-N-acetylhexosaminidase [Burkholderia gladioli]|uniref:beta-N-acetylhexosaminidase n=1 Tax=Burkholderia gladioli TaxID=28095 RepID=UPI00163FAE41|nr:beta-N-acetylhexosaminidase [Burkholderia gladioli]
MTVFKHPRLLVDLGGPEISRAERALLDHPCLAGFVLFEKNIRDSMQVRDLCSEILTARSDLIIGIDHEGGRIQSVIGGGITSVPAMRELWGGVKVFGVEEARLAYALGFVMGKELRDHGVTMVFSPVLDLDYGVDEVIGDRAFHCNPDMVYRICSSLVDGFHAVDMMCCGKHFPGHGFATVSTDSIPVDLRCLDEMHLDWMPYEKLSSKLDAIMVGHVNFPRVDENLASCSEYWVSGRLRGDLGYKGLIIADDISMPAARMEGDKRGVIIKAASAGNDLIMVFNEDSVEEKLDLLNLCLGVQSEIFLGFPFVNCGSSSFNGRKAEGGSLGGGDYEGLRDVVVEAILKLNNS